MSDHAVYLYAVSDLALTAADGVSALRGVDGSTVRIIADAGLVAVVSSVAPSQYNEESLRQSLQDPGWLEETARAHDTVVASLARTHTIAPVRMATVYRSDDNVRTLLRERSAVFGAALDRVRGRAEWGVKGFATRRPDAQPPAVSGAGPGTAYLMRRRAQRDQAATTRERSLDAAESVHRRIAGIAVASRRYPPQDPRLTGHSDEMVLNAAYLVDDARTEALEREVSRMSCSDLRLELTGPWAPYSFATSDEA
ncbi:MAG: hypothetical protein QOG20_5331 [Pseudonocardiales bacterium]|jgi:hypothetical protein|nr:hypothetical protein [Pseudonocardiales bacterium]